MTTQSRSRRKHTRETARNREESHTHLCDHPLEDVAAADGLEDLGGDSLGDALQALLHKGFALQRDAQVNTPSLRLKNKKKMRQARNNKRARRLFPKTRLGKLPEAMMFIRRKHHL